MNENRRWVDPPENPVLGPRSVHLWFAHLETNPVAFGRDLAVLSDNERTRAGRFRFEADRIRYVTAHATVRRVLSKYTGISPVDLRLHEDKFGKPSLQDNSELCFNASDAEDAALLAVARGVAVGVDIEKLRAVPDADRIASRYFTPAESEMILSHSRIDRDRAFLQLWTRKEAVIKAEGRGLFIPLDLFDCSGGEALVQASDGHELSRWRILTVDCGLDYLAALATQRQDPDTEHFLFR